MICIYSYKIIFEANLYIYVTALIKNHIIQSYQNKNYKIFFYIHKILKNCTLNRSHIYK